MRVHDPIKLVIERKKTVARERVSYEILKKNTWGNAPGAVANRVALEACVQARNEGRDLAVEGNEIIREACKWSPKLAAACEVWKEIIFNFPTIDKLDGQE